MIAAAHLDNFLFLIFFAVAILFQLLTRAAKTGRRPDGDSNRRSISPRPTSRQPEETEEDRVRKFLEALGQPTSSKPPPPVVTRPTYQKPILSPRVEPRRIARPVLSPLPPVTTRPPESDAGRQSPTEMPPPLAPISQAEFTAASKSAAAQTISKSEAKIDLATLLRSSSGLRDAIILREIFGPPRSLQPLDLVGSV